MKRLLIGGSGITGAAIASILNKVHPEHFHLTLWDKARGSGGRMSTSRFNKNEKCSVDLGAQYISSLPGDFSKNKSTYEAVLNTGVLQNLQVSIEGDRVFPDGTQLFVAPHGISSLVKYFLQTSGAEVKFNHQIDNISLEDDGVYVVKTTQGETGRFDGVILTMPVPQILGINGVIKQAIDENTAVRERLEAVKYSSRFAMGLYYEPGVTIDLPWTAKYFRGDPVIVFVSVDNKKRNQNDAASGTSILVHANVPFSLKYLEQDKEKICMEHVLPRLQHLLPQLPKPTEVKSHKWRYSQVHKGYEGSPGVVVLKDEPLLLCGGDGMTNSGFDRCLESARAVCDVLADKTRTGKL